MNEKISGFRVSLKQLIALFFFQPIKTEQPRQKINTGIKKLHQG